MNHFPINIHERGNMAVKKKDKSISIHSYRNKFRLNIGNLIFGIIAIYLIIMVFMYITQRRVSVYEVREGSILRDTSYTGLALRQEETVNTTDSGYINFYVTEGTKVGVNTNIYTLSDDKLKETSDSTEPKDEKSDQNEDSNNDSSAAADVQADILRNIQDFNDNYKDSSFSDTYTLKNNVQSTLENANNSSKLSQLDHLLKEGVPTGMTVYQTEKDGIVLYTTDNYEGMTVDTFTQESFDKSNYETYTNVGNEKIAKDKAAYKLITDEEWKVVIGLSKGMAKELAETTSIRVRFKKDNKILRGSFSIIKRDGESYGVIIFNNSMIRYASERFLDIDLILQDESGLKIPKTAVTDKEFYVVPDEYITTGGDSDSSGVYRKKAGGNSTTEFLATEVYYKADGKSYLDPDDFEKGDSIVMPDSSDILDLSTKEKLQGVYNINKGYAVFKLINILVESDEYYIVEEGSDYGLSNYDHIALDGTNLDENDIVF